jgi:predicted metal-dependent peptidase
LLPYHNQLVVVRKLQFAALGWRVNRELNLGHAERGTFVLIPDVLNGEPGEEPKAPVTPGGFGQVLDAPPPDAADGKDVSEQARDWEIAVGQAETLAKLAGKVPAGLNRALDGSAEAGVDWRELLRRLWSETSPADYSWMRPNRRHIWQGLYLPGIVREGVGRSSLRSTVRDQ